MRWETSGNGPKSTLKLKEANRVFGAKLVFGDD